MKARNRGFTLIELMVTLSVLAILLAIAAPSFSELIMNNRLATAVNEVQSALNFARAEAVTRRQSVTVCISSDGASCSTTGHWQDGLLVYTAVAGDTQILRHVQLAGDGLKISPGSSTDFGSNKFIRFTARGGAVAQGSLRFCDTRTGNYGRQLTLFPVGRIESSKRQLCS
ncbi:MAG: GspH/FimT family pseudopilin [Proteobacteria bacterium]|nr:GspH/FimT family pseudopilin [Pseudomonadota bacterium]